MKPLSKSFTIFLVLLFALTGLVIGPSVYAKDTLIIAIPDMPPGADNDFHSHRETWPLIMNLYSHGMEYKYTASGQTGGADVLVPDFGNIEPRLFEKWALSEDGKTATFYLRKGIKSAYGNEFTTEDVIWRYQRNFANKALGTFFLICEDISDIKSIKIIDKYTFSTTANAPTPMAIHMKTNHYVGYIDSTEAKKNATDTDPWAAKWIAKNGGSGLGPYTVEQWKAGDRIVLKANPNYFRGAPKIKKIVLKVIPESSSRFTMLKQGTIDVATALTPREQKSLEGVAGVRNIHIKSNNCLWGLMNNTVKPFDNKLVRQAINFATPRSEIAETAFYGLAAPWQASLPTMYAATTDPKDFPYRYNLDKAKALLAKAGYPNGFETELAYDAAYAPAETTATLFKTSLAKIGIDVALRKMPSGAFMTKVAAGEMPFALWWDMPMLPDPNYAITLTYHSKSAINYERYSNPEVDRLLKEGNQILDWDERVRFHRKIQKIVMDDAPIVFVIERDYTVGIRDNIAGWNWATMQETDWSLLSFK
jgi:peptide/nickel transport system substrate-binding protein